MLQNFTSKGLPLSPLSLSLSSLNPTIQCSTIATRSLTQFRAHVSQFRMLVSCLHRTPYNYSIQDDTWKISTVKLQFALFLNFSFFSLSVPRPRLGILRIHSFSYLNCICKVNWRLYLHLQNVEQPWKVERGISLSEWVCVRVCVCVTCGRFVVFVVDVVAFATYVVQLDTFCTSICLRNVRVCIQRFFYASLVYVCVCLNVIDCSCSCCWFLVAFRSY